MIFPNLEVEPVVQVLDKTRLDASKTFTTPNEAAISLIRIKPSATDSFIDVTSLMYLDWAYLTDGNKTVTVEVTTDGAPVTITKDISVLTEANDYLFSNDSDLVDKESDILKWVSPGRASFKDKHRAAQKLIVSYLNDIKGFRDASDNRLTKASLIDKEEVRQWSVFLTLRLIFQSLSNAVDDVFDKKSRYYSDFEELYKNKSLLVLDLNGDNVKDFIRPTSIRIVQE